MPGDLYWSRGQDSIRLLTEIVDDLVLLHRCCSVLILADQLGSLRYRGAAAVPQKHVEYRMRTHFESRKQCSELQGVAQKTVGEGGRYLVL